VPANRTCSASGLWPRTAIYALHRTDGPPVEFQRFQVQAWRAEEADAIRTSPVLERLA